MRRVARAVSSNAGRHRCRGCRACVVGSPHAAFLTASVQKPVDVHANHVDVVAQLRHLFADGHHLVECPHALPSFEVRQVLVDLFEASVEVLHGAAVVDG